MEAINSPLALSNRFIIKAGTEITYGLKGTFIRCLEASGAFKVAVGDDTTGMAFEKGIDYTSPDNVLFEKFRLINEGASDVTAVLAFGRGKVTDNRLVVGSGLVNVGGLSLVHAKVTINNTATPILAADAAGTGYTLHNNSDAIIFLGGVTVDTATGFPLLPGEKFGWDNRAALYGIANTNGKDLRVLKGGS